MKTPILLITAMLISLRVGQSQTAAQPAPVSPPPAQVPQAAPAPAVPTTPNQAPAPARPAPTPTKPTKVAPADAPLTVIPPADEPPPFAPGMKIMRAIPIEEPPIITDLAQLPRTLPEDVKASYSQCHVPGNVVALTFDDGPHVTNTPRLLDMLKERGIKATFFLVGQRVVASPEIVQRIVAEGHELGNHTWSHPQLNRMKQTSVMEQLQSTHDAIVKACGVAPIIYRPPYGAILLSQRKAINEHFHYPSILWDVDPLDWQSPRSSEKVHDRVLAQTKSGSIILCHDIHQTTVDAMPGVLDELIARKFQFVTVTQLLNLDAQTARAAAPPPPKPTEVTTKSAATSKSKSSKGKSSKK